MSYKEALILKSVTIGKSVISIDLVVTKDVSDGKWNLDKNERYGLRKFCYIGGNFMSKLFQINSGIVGSTGTIMLEIDKYAKNEGMETYMASVNNKSSQKDYPSNHIVIGSILEKHVHRKMAAITGNEGGYTKRGTRILLDRIDDIKPDIIQIHNLHWDYVNIEMLFNYMKEHPNIRVAWTLHDCWAYTGNCPYYDMANCNLWQSECHDCKVYKQYPESYVDNSTKMHRKKKKWFLGMPNLTLITPSEWLVAEVKKSFLCSYPRVVIKNGIDINIFQHTESKFREEYNFGDKFIILGSAYSRSERKGYDSFLKLSEKLGNEYQIVMIGGFSEEQMEKCKKHNIVALPRTSSKQKLAELYSASDVFFNPTREEMFGLVNIEAQACGTPVITFRSGGSPECIGSGCGYVIDKEDINSAAEIIANIKNEGRPSYHLMRSWVEQFSADKTYKQYVELYNKLLERIT